MYAFKNSFKSCKKFLFIELFKSDLPGPVLESKGMGAIFQKKGKKGQNILKFWQKCTKLQNILKKGSLMRATIAHMKQLELALPTSNIIQISATVL